jgi:hypothetical protein
MVDDGFLIGFEDSSGNFVEVGRLNNLADDVTQPLEIKHQNSGERITLDSSGLKTQKIDDDQLYAGAFSGSDADARLDNALSAASGGETIYLERSSYTVNRTITKTVQLVGASVSNSGTVIDATFVIDDFETLLRDLRLTSGAQINMNKSITVLSHCIGENSNVDLNGNNIKVVSCHNLDVTVQSGNSCLIDSCTNTSVVDNGTGTIVGDIS